MPAPSKGEAAKREIITMRVTKAKRDQIVAAAEANGRSVSQEIEERLSLSLDADMWTGSAATTRLLRLISSSIVKIEEAHGPWRQNRRTWAMVKGAVEAVLEALKPSIPDDVWQPNSAAFLEYARLAERVNEIAEKALALATAYPGLRDRSGGYPDMVEQDYYNLRDELKAAGRDLESHRYTLHDVMLTIIKLEGQGRHEGRRMAAADLKDHSTHRLYGPGVTINIHDGKVEPGRNMDLTWALRAIERRVFGEEKTNGDD